MYIHEAAQQILKEAKRPMHAREICEEIQRQGLFAFGAKDPVSIVAQALRKKSEHPSNKGSVLFRRVGQGTFELVGSSDS